MTVLSDFLNSSSLGDRSVICETHGEYTSTGTTWKDREIWGGCPGCLAEQSKREQLEMFRKQQEERDQRQLASLLGRAGIPPRFAGKRFADYSAETDMQRRALAVCRDYADNFSDRLEAGSSLILCGKPGTGKTHLACAIANQIVHQQRRPVVFARVFDAIRTIKATWSRGSEVSETAAIQSFVTPDLLILDEVGVQFGSDAEMLLAFEIINGRYEAVRPTILLSNLPVDELKNFLGDRVMDRLREGGGKHVAFDWGSHRGRVA